MHVSVHQNPRQASTILVISFLSSYVLFKFFLMEYVSVDILMRIWLLFCVMPLLIIAYVQNPKKINKKALNAVNKSRITSKFIVLLLQVFSVYIYAFVVTELGLAYFSVFVSDLFVLSPLVFIVVVIYVYFVDRRLLDPIDKYAKIGEMLNRKAPIDRFLLRKFLLETLVKIIFIPFMYSGFLGNLVILLNTDWQFNTNAISLLLFNLGISVDMLIGIFGYLFSSAIINNQIKDTDSNLLGWIYALLCYPPLVWVMRKVNEQQDNLVWSEIVPKDTVIYWFLFLIINMTWIIYWLATFEFGMTFSNLSWRKLINTGVYRYTKHPAYIAKNIYWWLYTLPFMGVAFLSAEWWQNILGLTFVSLVYYGRAKSEERHLMKFPQYQHYCVEIDKKGIFRWLKKQSTH